MFWKKKRDEKIEHPQYTPSDIAMASIMIDYTRYDGEMKFLDKLINTNKEYMRSFFIQSESIKSGNMSVVEEVILEKVKTLTAEAFESISESYKEFMVKKYFGSVDSLIGYMFGELYLFSANVTSATNTNKAKKAAIGELRDIVLQMKI